MQDQHRALGHILLLPGLVWGLCWGTRVLESVGDIEKQKIYGKQEYGIFQGIFDSFVKLAAWRKTQLFVFIHLVFWELRQKNIKGIISEKSYFANWKLVVSWQLSSESQDIKVKFAKVSKEKGRFALCVSEFMYKPVCLFWSATVLRNTVALNFQFNFALRLTTSKY